MFETDVREILSFALQTAVLSTIYRFPDLAEDLFWWAAQRVQGLAALTLAFKVDFVVLSCTSTTRSTHSALKDGSNALAGATTGDRPFSDLLYSLSAATPSSPGVAATTAEASIPSPPRLIVGLLFPQPRLQECPAPPSILLTAPTRTTPARTPIPAAHLLALAPGAVAIIPRTIPRASISGCPLEPSSRIALAICAICWVFIIWRPRLLMRFLDLLRQSWDALRVDEDQLAPPLGGFGPYWEDPPDDAYGLVAQKFICLLFDPAAFWEPPPQPPPPLIEIILKGLLDAFIAMVAANLHRERAVGDAVGEVADADDAG
ncbi:hypothetical protein C8R46DRAFT_90976 [Mycena filopes]|nr:hypothetical protein C8R46DRAFT_90976 [Mycena filopes]